MKSPRYLVPDGTYMADPAAHVFNGRLYLYPSHDIESGKATMKKLESYMLKQGEVSPNASGRQEFLENLINEFI